ncbi:hypothetical protein [Burkholderia gladioli]|uniref:hypothetical protein n=1 Tax=Burkholderia gladioli TaxID=28095 RepID=UPI00163F67A1|nr:hypothetical protein [Burkholderia gladioli]
MRKIIQLSATAQVPSFDSVGVHDLGLELTVTALCDDGSAWLIRPEQDNSRWECLPQIPQGALLQDWLAEVGECLTRNHLFRADAIERVVNEHRAFLIEQHGAGLDATVTAREVAKRYK